MIFVATVHEPCLAPANTVTWRSPIPCLIVADSEKDAISKLQKRFSARLPEIEQWLQSKHPEREKVNYYEAHLVQIPETYSRAESVFSLVMGSKAKIIHF